MLWESSPNTPYGSITNIAVDMDDGGGETQALVKASTLAIPDGTTLVSASLTFYTNVATKGTISAYRMTQSWSASSTWSSFGGNGVNPGTESSSSLSFTIANPVDETFVTVDVTADVLFWLGGGLNEGWVLISNSGNGWDFDSAETSRGPELVLTYS